MEIADQSSEVDVNKWYFLYPSHGIFSSPVCSDLDTFCRRLAAVAPDETSMQPQGWFININFCTTSVLSDFVLRLVFFVAVSHDSPSNIFRELRVIQVCRRGFFPSLSFAHRAWTGPCCCVALQWVPCHWIRGASWSRSQDSQEWRPHLLQW